MSPRIACNVTYAHLTAGLTPDEREGFDGKLYAPAGGWKTVDQVLAAVPD